MDAVARLADDTGNFFDPYLGTVVNFQRRARDHPARVYGKDERAEQRTVRVVQWAVDEDVILVASGSRCPERIFYRSDTGKKR